MSGNDGSGGDSSGAGAPPAASDLTGPTVVTPAVTPDAKPEQAWISGSDAPWPSQQPATQHPPYGTADQQWPPQNPYPPQAGQQPPPQWQQQPLQQWQQPVPPAWPAPPPGWQQPQYPPAQYPPAQQPNAQWQQQPGLPQGVWGQPAQQHAQWQQQQPPQWAQPQGHAPMMAMHAQAGYTPPMPQTYLVQSILATMFCCMPLGIVALIKATQVSSAWSNGDMATAELRSREARTWVNWSVLSSVVIGVGYVFLMVVLGFAGAI